MGSEEDWDESEEAKEEEAMELCSEDTDETEGGARLLATDEADDGCTFELTEDAPDTVEEEARDECNRPPEADTADLLLAEDMLDPLPAAAQAGRIFHLHPPLHDAGLEAEQTGAVHVLPHCGSRKLPSFALIGSHSSPALGMTTPSPQYGTLHCWLQSGEMPF